MDFSHIFMMPPEGTGLPPSQHAYGVLSGTFTPYDADELTDRYADRDAYDAMVKAAADELLANKYILQEDYDAYIAGAIELPEIPDPPAQPDAGTEPPPPGDDDDGCGCSTNSAGGTLGGGVLFLLTCALLGFRRRRTRWGEHLNH